MSPRKYESRTRGMTCSVVGCDRPRKYAETGLCQTHYHRRWRHGDEGIVLKANWWKDYSEVTYRGAHNRVSALWGKASRYPCVECGGGAAEWAYDGTDPDERSGLVRVKGQEYRVSYSAFPEFYMPLCISCHRHRDRSRWSERRTRCSHGHALVEGNVYRPPSGGIECRRCRSDRDRARYLERKGGRA